MDSCRYPKMKYSICDGRRYHSDKRKICTPADTGCRGRWYSPHWGCGNLRVQEITELHPKSWTQNFRSAVHHYLPLTIFLISFSLFNASIGVRLFTSRLSISSRIWQSIGSSNWKKLSCIPLLFSLTSANGLPEIPC